MNRCTPAVSNATLPRVRDCTNDFETAKLWRGVQACLFGGSELEFVFEGISGCEVNPNAGVCRIGTARLFEPPYRLVRAGLEQMNTPNTVVTIVGPGIARAETYRLLVSQERFIYRSHRRG